MKNSEPERSEETVKVTIPRELYMEIVKIQAKENVDFIQACRKAAIRIEPNSRLFTEAVRSEAQSLAKSQFMKQINQFRGRISSEARDAGMNYVRLNEDNFRVPCPRCRRWMFFSSQQQGWDNVRAVLNSAFRDWAHVDCQSQSQAS